MDNLTRSLRIAFPVPDCNPVLDHTLIICKRLGSSGLEFREMVPAGQRFQKKLLERGPFEGFAVSQDDNLRHVFSHPDRHSDQIHSYSLRFTLFFRVSDPRQLVERLESDPVRRLQQETVEVLGGTARRLEWRLIAEENRDLEKILLQHETLGEQSVVLSNFERLRRVAQHLGLAINTISIQRSLPERETQVGERVRDIQEGAYVKTVAHEADLLQGQWDAQLKVGEAITKVTVDSILSMKDATAANEALQKLRNLSSLGSETRKLTGFSFSTGEARQLASGTGGGALDGLLSQALELVAGLDGSPPTLRLGSAMLHIIAELYLRGEAGEEVLTKYAEQLGQALGAREVSRRLSPEQIRLVDRFRKPLAIRSELAQEEA